METKSLRDRLGSDRLGDKNMGSVRLVSQRESTLRGLIEEARFLLRTDRSFRIVVVLGIVLTVFLFGLIVGKAVSAAPVEEAAPSLGGVVITRAQAEEYQHLAMALEQAENDVAVSEGETDFHRAQAAVLADEVTRLQSMLGEAQLELHLIVSIYEECVERLYPMDCIRDARPEADAFLAELYKDQG